MLVSVRVREQNCVLSNSTRAFLYRYALVYFAIWSDWWSCLEKAHGTLTSSKQVPPISSVLILTWQPRVCCCCCVHLLAQSRSCAWSRSNTMFDPRCWNLRLQNFILKSVLELQKMPPGRTGVLPDLTCLLTWSFTLHTVEWLSGYEIKFSSKGVFPRSLSNCCVIGSKCWENEFFVFFFKCSIAILTFWR